MNLHFEKIIKTLRGSTFFLSGFLSLIVVCLSTAVMAQTPVAQHGALKVASNKIVDKNNQPVSLAGNSLFWSNAGWGGENTTMLMSSSG